MNRRTYVESALLRQPSQRVPCFPLVDLVYGSVASGIPMDDAQLNPARHAEVLVHCARKLPIDGAYVNLCLGAKQASRAEYRGGQHHVRIDDCLDITFAENDVAAIARTDIHDLDDSRMETAGLFHPGMLETFQALPKTIHGEVAMCVGLTGAFSQTAFLFGMQNLMLAMVDDPAAVHRAIQKRQTVVLRQAAEIIAAGAKFIWIGEGIASSNLISPRMYAEFVLPYEQATADEIRRLGGLSLLHICGNITPSLAAIAESRVDGIDVDSPTDWKSAVDILGPRMCLKGNISPMLFLPRNTGELEFACESALRIAAPLQGFILSTGCLVPRDSAVDAFTIMAKTCGISQGINHAG